MRKELMISNVEALWPRLDKPYRFNRQKMENEPCDATADQAKYELSFNMSPEQANWLHGEMKAAYDAERQPDWPDFPKAGTDEHPFKKNDVGEYRYKASKKAAYDGQATTPPTQWDAQANKLPKDFQLTTGSKINMNVKMIPYSASMGHGVSLRLMAVQVLEAAEKREVSPFGATQGSFIDDRPFKETPKPEPEKVAHPFGQQYEAPPAPSQTMDFDDEIPFG